MKELVYRLGVFLKRRNQSLPIESSKKLEFGKCSFDYDNLQIVIYDQVKTLTHREWELLKLLLDNANSLVKREDILIKIWGENDYFMGRSMDVYITKLRKHLKADDTIQILTLHGEGFKLVSTVN